VLYTLGLAALGAVVVGVLPALRATRAQLRSTLSALTGGSKPQLGRTWTVLIVTQVAITVAALPPAMLLSKHWVSQGLANPGFPVEEYLSAGLLLERETRVNADDVGGPEFKEAMRATHAAFVARLETDPTVAGATFAAEIPGNHPYDIAQLDNASGTTRATRSALVAVNYFDVFGVSAAVGRTFTSADVLSATARPVVVNRSFVERMPFGGNAVGRRIRFAERNDTTQRGWREIVGVVGDFPAGNLFAQDPGDTQATVYEPTAIGELENTTLFVRVRGAADLFASRFRAIATATDPSLQLRRVQSLENAYALQRRDARMTALAIVLVIGSVLLLSAAGIYAMMSFTVSQRRREIGVRVALGADTRRILGGVLGRAAMQLAIGVGAGLALVLVVDRALGGGFTSQTGLLIIPGTALFMTIVGIIAAAGPARHGLRIQPTEALRAE
jgi:hypothetical protein